jgi:hypothetical protein
LTPAANIEIHDPQTHAPAAVIRSSAPSSCGPSAFSPSSPRFGAPPGPRADCEVTDTGIPDEAAFKIDPGGVRQALAKNGIQLSGIYYGESFGNWGGLKQGATYDRVLDMHSMPI